MVLKSIINKMECSLETLNSGFERAGKRINKLKDILIEITQSKEQRENKTEEK